MRINHLLCLIALVLVISTAAKGQIQVRVIFAELPNLTYQLDCVSDLPVNCSRQNLGELWNREFLKTDEDRRLLKEWARLRDLYSKDIRFPDTSGVHSSALNLFDKIRIAGLQAAGVEDYATRLDLLTAPPDHASFAAVIKYFEPKFKLWWEKEAEQAGGEFAKQTDILLRSPKISEPVKQFYNFYAPILPADYQISFNLFYIPGTIKEQTSGQQLENYSLMEFKAKENPAQRIDVAVHELCHFFYDNMKPEARARLEERFHATGKPSAAPAYNLLNESLAAAFGNGIIARAVTPPGEYAKYLAADKSFYNNDSIDRAAKAILPILDERLKRGKAIEDAGFVDDYIAALEKSFGADLLRPKLYLSEMFLFVDKKFGVSMRRDIRRTLETASFYSIEADWSDKNILDDYRGNPRLNSVFIVHPGNLDELVKNKILSDVQLKAVRDELAAKQQVLFGAERAPFTYVYIIVAQDADGAKELTGKLVAAKQFQGVYAF